MEHDKLSLVRKRSTDKENSNILEIAMTTFTAGKKYDSVISPAKSLVSRAY